MRPWGPWQDCTVSWDYSAALCLTWPFLPFCGDVSVLWVCLCSARCKLALRKYLYFYSEAVSVISKFLSLSMALLRKDAGVGDGGLQRHKSCPCSAGEEGTAVLCPHVLLLWKICSSAMCTTAVACAWQVRSENKTSLQKALQACKSMHGNRTVTVSLM